MYPQGIVPTFNLKGSISPLLAYMQLEKVCEESPFPSNYLDGVTFNDTSLHIFPKENLQNIDPAIWDNSPEPVTDPSDVEIIISNTT